MAGLYHQGKPVSYVNNRTLQSMVEARFAVITSNLDTKYLPVKECLNQTTENNLLCADWSSFNDPSNLIGTYSHSRFGNSEFNFNRTVEFQLVVCNNSAPSPYTGRPMCNYTLINDTNLMY